MAPDTKKLFQITEAAHACGLSRSTLMRLEEKGLLTPAYIAPESGRRYYDNHNVARILQIEKFKTMGLSTDEIAAYYTHGGEASGQLAVQEKRLHDLQRSVEELRLRAAEPPSWSVQVMTLPAVTCRIHWMFGLTFKERYDAMYAFYADCVRRGGIFAYRAKVESDFGFVENVRRKNGKNNCEVYQNAVREKYRSEAAERVRKRQ